MTWKHTDKNGTQMVTAGIQITATEWEAFKATCKATGKTQKAALSEMVRGFVRDGEVAVERAKLKRLSELEAELRKLRQETGITPHDVTNS